CRRASGGGCSRSGRWTYGLLLSRRMSISQQSRWCQSDEVGGSVFRGQEQRCAEAMTLVISRLGDDPEALVLVGHVGAEDAGAVPHGCVVVPAVFVVQVAPVADHVAGEELMWLLPGSLEGYQGTRGGDDPPEA